MFKIGYRAIYQKNIRFAIQEAKHNGFAVLEIHLSSPQFLPARYSLKQLKLLKDFAKKQDIALQAHAPLEHSLIFVNPELRKSAKKQIEEMRQFCNTIGAQCLTLHIGKPDTYHNVNGKKLKADDIYPDFYRKLFEDSVKHIISLSSNDVRICVENTDNFSAQYQKVLDKYLPSGKIFLTWDIRKNYSYINNELDKDQWKFFQKNTRYVKNLHISGLNAAHGKLEKRWAIELNRFLILFTNETLPLIVEAMPLKYALEAKKIINRLTKRSLII